MLQRFVIISALALLLCFFTSCSIGLEAGEGIDISGNETTGIITISGTSGNCTECEYAESCGNSTLSQITGTVGETVTIGTALYYKSDGKWYKAKADTVSTVEGLLGMATGNITANDTGVILLRGFIEYTSWNLTVGAPQFVSSATAGGMTETKPSAAGHFVRRVGWAYAETILYFDSDATLIGL